MHIVGNFLDFGLAVFCPSHLTKIWHSLNSKLITDRLSKANAFNDYFSSIFNQENMNLLSNLCRALFPDMPSCLQFLLQ